MDRTDDLPSMTTFNENHVFNSFDENHAFDEDPYPAVILRIFIILLILASHNRLLNIHITE